MGTVHGVAKSGTWLNDFPFQGFKNTAVIKLESPDVPSPLSPTLQMHLGNNGFPLIILDIHLHMGYEISLKNNCLSALKVASLT